MAFLKKVLAILPVVRANQGIRVDDLAALTGISRDEIVSELPSLVNLCGVPPYSPVDLVDLSVEGDRVTIRFADQFRRPVRLTPREALALDMALAGFDDEGESPFARAVADIRAKVRTALQPEVKEVAERTTGRITAVKPVGLAGRVLSEIKDALARQVAVRVSYFSRSRGTLADREIHPYGIYEQGGHWYVVAWSVERGRVQTFRADRIRAVALLEEEYEIPEEFEVSSYRMEGPPIPDEPAVACRVRFLPDVARFARETFPAERFEDEPEGGVVAELRTTATGWLVSELLKWGPSVRVEAPEALREELAARAREALGLYGR